MMLHIKIQTECHATLKIEVLEKKYSGVHRIYR